VTASATDSVYAGVFAAPQPTAGPFNFSIFIPAARAWRVIRRIQVTAREVNAERADHPPHRPACDIIADCLSQSAKPRLSAIRLAPLVRITAKQTPIVAIQRRFAIDNLRRPL